MISPCLIWVEFLIGVVIEDFYFKNAASIFSPAIFNFTADVSPIYYFSDDLSINEHISSSFLSGFCSPGSLMSSLIRYNKLLDRHIWIVRSIQLISNCSHRRANQIYFKFAKQGGRFWFILSLKSEFVGPTLIGINFLKILCVNLWFIEVLFTMSKFFLMEFSRFNYLSNKGSLKPKFSINIF